MRRLRAWSVPRVGNLLVGSSGLATVFGAPKLVSGALLLSGLALDGVRYQRKRVKRRPGLDPFGNPILDASRVRRP